MRGVRPEFRCGGGEPGDGQEVVKLQWVDLHRDSEERPGNVLVPMAVFGR